MPLRGAEYQERTQEEILAFLSAEMRAEFGEDIDLTESSSFRTFAEAISAVDAEEIEPALSSVHDAAFLESAEGENLGRVVSILGIQRRSAVHATGTIRFGHGGTAESTYSITNGTSVQTQSSDPVEFETAELVTLNSFDTFEESTLDSNYAGQSSEFSIVDGSASGDPSPSEGDSFLKGPQTDGSKIFNDSAVVERGSEMDFRMYLPSGAAAGSLFGVRDSTDYYRVRLDTSAGTHAVEISTPSGVTTLDSSSVNIPTDEWLRVSIQWDGQSSGRIISRVLDANGDLVDEVEVTEESDIDGGGFGFESLDGSTDKYWDHSGERAVHADARAREGGYMGNVGSNTLTVTPTVPSGIESVTNPHPMGDDEYNLTSTLSFSAGRPEETDSQLRDRASVSEGARGEGTVPAIIAALRALPEAVSVSVYENKENSTDGDGLPPKSFELVYYGNDDPQVVANTLFDVKAFTSRDHGGAHGTEVTETVEAENGQIFTMHWSEPTELAVDMTLELVVDDTFIGEEDIRDRIVDHVGGVDSAGTDIIGTGTGENIYIDQIEDIVTGPEDTGVIGIASQSYTPSTTTDANGLSIIDVGENEVATTNAQDGSIELTITRV